MIFRHVTCLYPIQTIHSLSERPSSSVWGALRSGRITNLEPYDLSCWTLTAPTHSAHWPSRPHWAGHELKLSNGALTFSSTLFLCFTVEGCCCPTKRTCLRDFVLCRGECKYNYDTAHLGSAHICLSSESGNRFLVWLILRREHSITFLVVISSSQWACYDVRHFCVQMECIHIWAYIQYIQYREIKWNKCDWSFCLVSLVNSVDLFSCVLMCVYFYKLWGWVCSERSTHWPPSGLSLRVCDAAAFVEVPFPLKHAMTLR